MPKPLRLCLPAAPAFSTWTRIHDVGEPAGGTGYYDTLGLETTEDVAVLAACDGLLSIFPEGMPVLGPPIIPPWIFAPFLLPPTVSLYLTMIPGTVTRTDARLRGFLYRDLETSSLAATLGAALDSIVLGDGDAPTRDEMVMALLTGAVSVPVLAGQPIGKPALVGAGPARQYGFAAYDFFGIKEPLGVYDEQRDYVDDGQAQVDLLLGALPRPDDLFEPGLSKADAIARTATRLYPWSVLNTLPGRYGFDIWSADWRSIGNHQKALYLERLRVRVGYGGPSTEPPFEFNDPDYKNTFQLEAVVEFYANYDDPWKAGAAPVPPNALALSGNEARSAAGRWVTLDGTPALGALVPNHDKIYLPASRHPSRTYRIVEVDDAGHRVRVEGDPRLPAAPAPSTWQIKRYQVVDLLDPGGTGASPTPGNTLVQLDFAADLTRVWPNDFPVDASQLFDTIYLEEDQGRANKLYKIVAVDPEARTVTVDAAPVVAHSGPWHINQRPWLIAIDPIGGRQSGVDASTDPADPGRVTLPTADLSRINVHFDTLYLPSDVARPSRTYRIEEVNQAGHWVRVAHDAGNPPILGGLETWSIQAGVSANLVAQVYDLRSGRGYDHFDAVLFFVQGGQIQYAAPWTTFTSHNYADYDDERSSVRGNKDYEYFSYKSGKTFINFALKAVDFGAGARPGIGELFDGVREARWYYETVTRDDTEVPSVAVVGNTSKGKTTIRFHYGNDGLQPGLGKTASQSAGCIVSPAFDSMRAFMIDRYNAEFQAYQGVINADLQAIAPLDHGAAKALLGAGGGPSFQEWRDKLVGRVWVIRPGERPL